MYDRAFTQLGKLYKGKGWYELRSWEELTTDPGPKGDL
jgi:hypothetical protein